MSRQRRRGQWATVYRTKVIEDRRGNQTVVIDEANPITVRAAFIPQRSSKAEVPGQQQINVTRMICDPTLTDLNLWSRVEWRGSSWDIAAPPLFHFGSRHTRHWSIDLRERPS